MVAVSAQTCNYIQFIDIVGKEVYNEIQIPGSKRGGVAASNTNLFVCDKCAIHALDHQGWPVRTCQEIASGEILQTPH